MGPSGSKSHPWWTSVPTPLACRGASVVGVWNTERAPHSGQRSPELRRGNTASQIVHFTFMTSGSLQALGPSDNVRGMYQLALAVHFWSLTFWIGSLLAGAALIEAGDARARRVLVFADVGATITILAGVYLGINATLFKQPWLHIKLALVVLLLIAHVRLRIRAKRGVRPPAGAFLRMLGFIAVVAAGIMYLAVFKPIR
jgi:hypothetical protein